MNRTVTPNDECHACRARTKDGKPFCIDHLDSMPHPGRLYAELAQFEEEIERASRLGTRGIVVKKSVVVTRIIEDLHLKGPQTIERLGQEIGVKSPLLEPYIKAMIKARMVGKESFNTNGGKPVVKLVALVVPPEDTPPVTHSRTSFNRSE